MSAVIAASTWIVASPAPAGACDLDDPCTFMECRVNKPYVDPNSGTIYLQRPVECYF